MSFWINFIFTFARRKKWLIISLTAAFLLAVTVGVYLFNLKKQDVLSEGIVGTHEERDLPDIVLNLISSPLIRVDKSGTPIAQLAQSWESNEQANVYKVKLKENLYWSDGEKLTAADVYLSIPDVSINALDESTLEFKLAETFSPFPTLLTKPVLRKASTQFGFELVGVGPYSVKAVKKDGPFVKRLDLEASEEKLPDLDITFYPSEKIAKTALKLGEVQSLLGVIESDDLSLNNLGRKVVTNYRQLVTVFLNTEDPILSDENLRLALAYGSPEFAGQEIAQTPLSPFSWAHNNTVKDFLNNNEKAQVALKKVEKGKEEQISLTATSSLERVGEKVVESWKNLGLNAVLRVESGIPQNFQALLITQNIPADPDQYSLWHSTQKNGTNISRVASPRIDKDLEDGRKITDLETRKQKYKDFQKILLDQAPAIFLYFPKYEVVYMKKAEKQLNEILPIQLIHLN
ncbi:ABC transporter substrate-binding protein [Candidatus Daviesbacteria bacterium]|nr:ABC transporter substrate-binding protein [Candidatus Daviesbacteria bacterium]